MWLLSCTGIVTQQAYSRAPSQACSIDILFQIWGADTSFQSFQRPLLIESATVQTIENTREKDVTMIAPDDAEVDADDAQDEFAGNILHFPSHLPCSEPAAAD